MTAFEVISSLCAFVICAILGTLIFLTFRTKNSNVAPDSKIKKRLLWILFVSFFDVIFYALFILSNTYFVAFAFFTIHQCAILLFSMQTLLFSLVFTETYSERIRFLFRDLILILVSADISSLLINLKTLHNFDLTLGYFGQNIPFWTLEAKPFYFVHEALCALLLFASFFALIFSTIRAPMFYKKKFVRPLFSILVLASFHILSQSILFPVDFSIPFLAFFAWAGCRSAIFSQSHRLVEFMLSQANELIDDGLISFTADGKLCYSNFVARKLMGSGDHLPPLVAEKYFNVWRAMYREGQFNVRDSFLVDGIEHHFRVEYKNLDAGGIRLGSYFMFVDRTKETVRLLSDRHSATHDELTGLFNRTGFFDAVSEAQKTETEPHLMLASNIKDFKLVNELFGSEMGDIILKRLANFIKFYAHADTIAGRIADDKFALYLKKSNFDKELFMYCFKKVEQITQEGPYCFHIFVGIYEITQKNEPPNLMFDKASLAISRISDDYQSVFSKYDAVLMEELIFERSIVDEFENALLSGQFCLFLQGQVKSDGSLYGAEVLVRWNHPVRGHLLPNKFIGILEKTGLIYKLDTFVWEETAKILKKWKMHGIHCRLSVNVSPKDGYYIDLSETLSEIAARNEISPASFGIEMSENVLMADFSKSQQVIDELRLRGFSVAIDAFGVGYSSLNMLKDICVSEIKIDREFLSETTAHPAKIFSNRDIFRKNGRNFEILRIVVEMAEELGMRVIVQGVEKKEQHERFLPLPVSALQGNYFSPPISVLDFEKTWLHLQ